MTSSRAACHIGDMGRTRRALATGVVASITALGACSTEGWHAATNPPNDAGEDGSAAPSCPIACITAVAATFELSCSPNDLTNVIATGPCATPDAALSWYTGSATEWDVAVTSAGPGACHVELTFATGFTYSADVTFALQTIESPPGCPECPPYVGPTSGPFMVDNPSDTCDSMPASDSGTNPSGDANVE